MGRSVEGVGVMDKKMDGAVVAASENSQAAVIDTSGFSLDAVRALAQRRRLPGRSWSTELRLPIAAMMGAR